MQTLSSNFDGTNAYCRKLPLKGKKYVISTTSKQCKYGKLAYAFCQIYGQKSSRRTRQSQKLLLRFYYLKTFIYEFVNCKPSKNEYVSSFTFKNPLLFAPLLYHCSHLTDTIIIITVTACPTQLFAILLRTSTVLLEPQTQLVTQLLELQLTTLSIYFVYYSYYSFHFFCVQ